MCLYHMLYNVPQCNSGLHICFCSLKQFILEFYLFFFLLFAFLILLTVFFTLLSPLSFLPPVSLLSHLHHSSSYPLFLPRCIWTTAAQFSGGPASLGGLRPGAYPGHCPNVALQPDHAHAAGATPHPALLPGGHRGPDGVVQGELAWRGEENKGAGFACLTLLLRVCVFSGSDGEKIIQLVVRISCICAYVWKQVGVHILCICVTRHLVNQMTTVWQILSLWWADTSV